MSLKYYGIALFLLLSTTTNAQSKHSVFTNLGYSFNKNIELKEVSVKKSQSYAIELGYYYQLFQMNASYVEIGLSGKTIFASGEVNNRAFDATTFRISIPLKWVFSIPNSNIQLGTGFILQNNVDFDEFDRRLRDKYGHRINYLFETKFLLKNQAYLTIGSSVNIRNIPDPYFINDPKFSFILGFQKTINFNRDKY